MEKIEVNLHRGWNAWNLLHGAALSFKLGLSGRPPLRSAHYYQLLQVQAWRLSLSTFIVKAPFMLGSSNRGTASLSLSKCNPNGDLALCGEKNYDFKRPSSVQIFLPVVVVCKGAVEKGKESRKDIGPSISQFDRFFLRWHKQKLGRPQARPSRASYSRNHQVFIVLLLTFHGHPSLLIGHNRTGRIWSWWEIIFPFPSVSS